MCEDKEIGCEGCPFNFFSEESERIQNYGCLPTPADIVNMRVSHQRTWACHSDPKTPCRGALAYLKEHNLPHQPLELIDERSPWHLYTENLNDRASRS